MSDPTINVNQEEWSEFVSIIDGNLSTENSIRTQAEQKLSTLKQTAADKFISYLLHYIKQSNTYSNESRIFCFIILRQNLVLTNELYTHLHSSTQQSMKHTFIELLIHEENQSTLSKLIDTISMLAARYGNTLTQEWSSLIEILFTRLAKSHKYIHQYSTLKLLHSLSEYSIVSIEPYLRDVLVILTSSLRYHDTNGNTEQQQEIQLLALHATIQLLLNIDSEKRIQLSDITPLLFQTLGAAYNNADDDTIQSAVESLLTLAAEHPQFLKKHIQSIITAMLSIASNTQLELSTQRIGMEFLITLSEAGKNMIRKQHDFAHHVIPLAIQYIVKHVPYHEQTWLHNYGTEEDIDGDKGEGDDDETYETYQVGLEAIGRLSASLGNKTFSSVVLPLIHTYILDPTNWKHRHAALMIIASAGETSFDPSEPSFKALLQRTLQLAVHDPHPRVRYAAAHVIASLSEYYAPIFQQQHASAVIPVFLQIFKDPQAKLVRHGCLCFVNFVNGLVVLDDEDVEDETVAAFKAKLPDILQPYREAILQQLISLVTLSNNTQTQEAAVRALSSLFFASKEQIVPYYDMLMNGLKQIVSNASAPEQKQLRSSAIDAIGILAEASGIEKFGTDAAVILEACFQMLTRLQAHESEYESVYACIARIASVMKQSFAPYLHRIVPLLLQSAAITDAALFMDVTDAKAASLSDKAGFESATVDLKELGQKQISVNTSLMQEKTNATNTLYDFANKLGSAYFPHAEQTIATLVPNLRYAYSPKIRAAAVQSLPGLFKCIADYYDNNGNTATSTQEQRRNEKIEFVQKQWFIVFQPLQEAIRTEPEIDALVSIIESFVSCVEVLPFQLPHDQLVYINHTFRVIIEDSIHRVEEREKGNDDDEDGNDDEKIALHEAAVADENNLLGTFYTVTAQLLKLNSLAYLPPFDQQLAELYMKMLSTDIEPLATTGLCVLGQILNDLGHNEITSKYYEPLMRVALPSLTSPIPDLRQASNFTVGSIAKCTGTNFQPYSEKTLQSIIQMLNMKNSRNDLNEPASTNGLSAISKIIRYSYIPLNVNAPDNIQKLLTQWVSYLPCNLNGDIEEAKTVHEELFYFLQYHSNELLGRNYQNIPRLLKLLNDLSLQPELMLPSTKVKLHQYLQHIENQQEFQSSKATIQKIRQQSQQALSQHTVG